MRITTGKNLRPQRVLLYGSEGVGKSTLAAQCPSPVFSDLEESTNHLDVPRLPVAMSWSELLAEIEYIRGDRNHSFGTFVIDSIDWAEMLCREHVCRAAGKASIEDFGFGRGYIHLSDSFNSLLRALNRLRVERQMHIVLVGHSAVRKFEQPDELGAYDRYELKLHKSSAAAVKEWADLVLFLNFKTIVRESSSGKVKGIGGRERVIYTTHTAAWDAKNRHGLADELPLSFDSISTAVFGPGPVGRAQVVADDDVLRDERVLPDGPAIDVAAYREVLATLLEDDGITADELCRFLAKKGVLSVGQPLGSLSDLWVEKLLDQWEKIKNAVNHEKVATKGSMQ